MKIRIGKDDMKKMVTECMDRLLLQESLPGVVFHFTTVSGLISILSGDMFKLADQEQHLQKHADEKRPYYMCFTRQKYGNTGYAKIMGNALARLTINGDLLNTRYRSVSYDFYAQNGKTTGREKMADEYDGKLPYEQDYVENEERLLSREKYIRNASRYIERIDVFGARTENELELLKGSKLADVTYMYMRKKDFDMQTRKCIRVTEVDSPEDLIDFGLSLGLTPAEMYPECKEIGNGLFVVQRDSEKPDDDAAFLGLRSLEKNLMDARGNTLLPEWVPYISGFENGYVVVGTEDRYNLVNGKGALVLKDWADEVKFMNGGYAARYGKKWYQVSDNGTAGDEITENEVEEVIERFKDVEVVRSKMDRYNMRKAGTEDDFVLGKWYDRIEGFGSMSEEDLAPIKDGDKWNYVRSDGSFVMPEWYDSVGLVWNHRGWVEKDGKIAVIDPNGNIISGRWYDDVEFDEDNDYDYAYVKSGKVWFELADSGEVTIKRIEE